MMKIITLIFTVLLLVGCDNFLKKGDCLNMVINHNGVSFKAIFAGHAKGALWYKKDGKLRAILDHKVVYKRCEKND